MDIEVDFKLLSYHRKISLSINVLKLCIIIVVLIASTIVSYWGTLPVLGLILALLGSVLAALILLQQIKLGLILVFLGGMFVPVSGPSGLNPAIVMVALMLGLWMVEMIVVQKRVALVRSQVMVPVIAFIVVSVLAFLVGQVPWFIFARQAPFAARVGGFAVFIFSVGCMLLTANLVKEIRWLKIISFTFLGLGMIYILGRLIKVPLIIDLYHYGSLGSMFWTWLVALPLGQAIYNDQLQPKVRWLLIVMILVTFYVAGVQGYDWKSGWVPPLVAAVLLLGIRYRKLVIFMVPLMAMIILYIILDLIASDSYSWGTRVDAWRIILEISRVSPLLGMGFANYYWYTPLFPIRGWYVSFNSHSQFVDLIAQTGYVGLFVFLWLFFELGRLSWTVARRSPGGFARGYAYGILAGIAASLVAAILGDWVLPFVYNVGLAGFRASILPWIFIGGVISLEQMLREPSVNAEARFA